MRTLIYFLMVSLISISTKGQGPKKAVPYRMKDITIQTIWAKEVGPTNALKEYPRPQLQRSNWINLNGLWDYTVIDSALDGVSKYDGKILVPYPLESSLSGVKKTLNPNEVIWYHRTFENPMRSRTKFGKTDGTGMGERLLLNFGAVSWEATVYVNDREAGNHRGSYTPFTLDITGLLKSGQNEIRIKVWNPLEKGIGPRGKQTLNPSGMWYTASSGIWQTVWLERVPVSYIKSINVTPDVDKGRLALSVASNISPEGREEYSAEAIAYDGKKEVSRSSFPLAGVVKVPNAKLWSPDSPFLYHLVIKLKKNGKVIDEVKSYFGMRKVEIKKDGRGMDRIFLNNKYTYNLGVLDQGFWPEGLYTAPTDYALKFDIEAIRAMGFNTIRKHIKLEPDRWYYHADKIGMLVWQDLVQPGGNFGSLTQEVKEQFEKESSEIVKHFSHFPSITTWVLFNEKWGEYDQGKLAQWIKYLDPSRLVNGHSGAVVVGGKLKDELKKEVIERSVNSDLTDIHSYPPPAIPNHIPGKAMVIGEFGGIGVRVEGHLWDDLQHVFGYGQSISGAKMKDVYTKMVDSLVEFQKQGLSASIYTQPYDVEGEQNGLMTYDRKKTKIPFKVIHKINSRLLSQFSRPNLEVELAETGSIDFNDQITLFKDGKRDSTFLRRLTILAWGKKDTASVRSLADAYLSQVMNPLAKDNLRFIQRFTRNTSEKGFLIFLRNMEKVNEILGKDAAEQTITGAIERTEIRPNLRGGNPNWEELEKSMVAKYGELGREIIWQEKVINSLNNQNWDLFESALVPWYEKYGHKRKWIGVGFINNVAWSAFEHINNPTILTAVSNMTAHCLSIEPEDTHLLDTHANLLYKLGQTTEAFCWEMKAIKLRPDEEIYRDTLEKMRAGIRTWPTAEISNSNTIK